MGLEITLGATDTDQGRVRLGATDTDQGRVRLGSAITDQARVNIGDLVAILDGLDEAAAQYPGAGQNYTGGSDYSPYLPLSPQGLVGLDADLAAAAAQYPGAGQNYTGGSDYSPYLPLSPNGLVGFDALESAAAQFPGAGGTYTGGSDYSPMLPLNPNGLAFGVLDALTDFPIMGKLEAALLRGAGTEDELLGTETEGGRIHLGQHAVVRGQAHVHPGTRVRQATPGAAVSRSVHLAVTAAREPARREAVAARISHQASQLATLASQRRAVSQRAAAQYISARNKVDQLDQRIERMASGPTPTGARAGVLQRMDLDRREYGRQAVRYAKLHAVAELATRNAATQAVLGRQIAAGVRRGQASAVAPIARLFATIGQSTRQLRVVRQRQRALWANRTRAGSLDRLLARRARVGKVVLRLQLTSQRGPLPSPQQQLFRKAQAAATRLDTAIARVRAGTPAVAGNAPRSMSMGFASAEAQFPGAGGTYTGGSDYSPSLPLSPNGLVGFGEFALAEDEPDEGLGNIFRSIGRAVRNAARTVARAAKKVVGAACGLLRGPIGAVATAAAGVATGGAGAAAGVAARTACGVAARALAPRAAARPAARPAAARAPLPLRLPAHAPAPRRAPAPMQRRSTSPSGQPLRPIVSQRPAPEATPQAPLPEAAPTPTEAASSGLPSWVLPVGIGVAGAALLAVMLL